MKITIFLYIDIYIYIVQFIVYIMCNVHHAFLFILWIAFFESIYRLPYVPQNVAEYLMKSWL